MQCTRLNYFTLKYKKKKLPQFKKDNTLIKDESIMTLGKLHLTNEKTEDISHGTDQE